RKRTARRDRAHAIGRIDHRRSARPGREIVGGSMSKERPIPHQFEGERLESVFVGRRDGQARPTVILIPTVMGVSDLELGFGGQCALDLARSGADIAAAVSFHGLFDPPGLPPEKIKAKVVAFHGWDDPMVPPDKVVALGQELTEAGSDWQIHAYGNVAHGFTNPKAHEIGIDGVRYNAL